MDLNVDLRQPVRATVGRLESSHRSALGLAADEGSALTERGARQSGTRQYSYWAECECPGDCLRDHENE
jgi:hypothetical protein